MNDYGKISGNGCGVSDLSFSVPYHRIPKSTQPKKPYIYMKKTLNIVISNAVEVAR